VTALLALAAALGATAPASGASASAGTVINLPAFFSGRSHSEGELKIVFHGTEKLVIDSVGRADGDGNFVLVDTVHEGDKPVRTRKWVMRPVGPNHFSGTLSDANGPVDAVVDGNQATISYTMNGGLKVQQVMQLQGDGRTLANHVDVRKFGLRFARMDGFIRKLD